MRYPSVMLVLLVGVFIHVFSFRSFASERKTSTIRGGSSAGLHQEGFTMVLSEYQQTNTDKTIAGDSSMRPFIIGIAGGSGGGKTTLVNKIVEKLGSTEIECISHDSYYRDLHHLSIEERALTNFDHPSSLDTDLLISHIQRLKDGHRADVPIYDFTTHSRTVRTTTAYPKRIIIIDGILIFSINELLELMDLKVFVDCEDDIRLLRRIRRDTSERARSVESVISQYESCVKPMYDLFVEPSRSRADVIIPTTDDGLKNAAVDMIVSYIKEVINVSDKSALHCLQ